MGLIKDIDEKIVPRTQELMEKQGLNLKQALHTAFKEFGYIGGNKSESIKRNKTK